MTTDKLRRLSIANWVMRLQMDVRGQDIVEYALITGFVAMAGASVVPTLVLPHMDTIYRKVEVILKLAVTRLGDA